MYSELEPVPQRVAVIGGGAVGCYMAMQAYQAGHQVHLCVRTPFNRLIIDSAETSHETPVTITADPQTVNVVDWVLITTKAQDTRSTKPWLDNLVDADTVAVVLQNGINHEEQLRHVVDRGFILPGLVYVAVERLSPGHIVHRSGNRIIVPDGEQGARFRDLLRGSTAHVVLDPDFLTAAWKKLLSNLAANPITAITLQRMGIMQRADIGELAQRLLDEGVRVGQAAGAHIGQEDIDETLALYNQFTPDGGTSMLYDRLAGRPLEHEYITGAVVRAGQHYGIPTPFNQTLLTLLRALS